MSTTPTPGSAAHVRAWAREHGWTVGSKGRFSADLVDAYNAAHRHTPYTVSPRG